MAKKDGFSAIIGLTFWKGCLYNSGRKERKPMVKVPVNFQRTEDAVEFVKIVNQYPFQMDLISGNHIVDAKSLLGTIEISKADRLSLRIYSTPSPSTEQLLAEVQDYL